MAAATAPANAPLGIRLSSIGDSAERGGRTWVAPSDVGGAPEGAAATASARGLPRAHPSPGSQLARLLADARRAEAGDPGLLPRPPARPRAHPLRRRHPGGKPPQLPRSLRDRLLPSAPDLLRRQARAVQEPDPRLVPQLHGR